MEKDKIIKLREWLNKIESGPLQRQEKREFFQVYTFLQLVLDRFRLNEMEVSRFLAENEDPQSLIKVIKILVGSETPESEGLVPQLVKLARAMKEFITTNEAKWNKEIVYQTQTIEPELVELRSKAALYDETIKQVKDDFKQKEVEYKELLEKKAQYEHLLKQKEIIDQAKKLIEKENLPNLIEQIQQQIEGPHIQQITEKIYLLNKIKAFLEFVNLSTLADLGQTTSLMVRGVQHVSKDLKKRAGDLEGESNQVLVKVYALLKDLMQ
jgi:hypothetical protein